MLIKLSIKIILRRMKKLVSESTLEGGKVKFELPRKEAHLYQTQLLSLRISLVILSKFLLHLRK